MLKRSSPRNCKMTFIIGRGFAEGQILKKWKWPYLLNCVEYIDKLLRKHWYWQDLAQEIANWHFNQSRLCRAPYSEKVKMALSLEMWRILWWILHTHRYWQELRIEKSVMTVIVQHRETCRVMPNSYPEWQDFQFAPNNHYGFFFLHTLPSTIAFRLEYVFIYQFYAEQK